MEIQTTKEFDNHQVEAITAAAQELAINDRCKIIMACGTGKTRVGRGLAATLKAKTVVIYVPSIALVRQTLPEWLHNRPSNSLDFLCICSDETVAAQGDEIALSVDELVAFLGIDQKRVTTDSDVIRAFLENSDSELRYVFCTYHSSNVLSESMPEGFAFDLGLFDEAHRTTGQNFNFSGPITNTHTSINKRVFMTATPKHFKVGKKDSEGNLLLAYSMDDEKLYGRTAYNLPIRKAIDLGIIADYQILVSVIDGSRISSATHTDNLKKHEAIAHAMAIKNAMAEYGLKKAVTFHNSISEAKFFAENELIKSELKIPIFHVSGQQKSNLRTEIMNKFEVEENSLVTNARCLTEGIDVPEIDLIAFLHPKKSLIDIIQAIGRALRKPRESSKKKGYILLPLYVKEATEEALRTALHEYGYKAIYEVVQALREQDELVDTAISKAAVNQVKNNGNTSGLSFITPTWNNNQVDILRSLITTKVVDELTISWDVNYELLREIYNETGNSNISPNLVYKDINLGLWVSNQRINYKNGSCSIERIEKLNALGFKWTPQSDAWEYAFSMLKEVYDSTGNSNVPDGFVYKDFKLGQWARAQRCNLKKSDDSSERIRRLTSLGFVWEIHEHKWTYAFALLKEVYDATGNANVPNNFVYKGFNLGSWSNTQRTSFKNNHNFPQARIDLLTSIGFIWDPISKKWDEAYDLLKAYYQSTGDININSRKVYKNFKLGQWLRNQRVLRLKGNYPKDRVEKLEKLGFQWADANSNCVDNINE